MNQESGTTAAANPVSTAQLELMNAWWHAANYLSVGQIYLLDNPLLDQPLERDQIKPRLLGHWGTTPGLNFIYVHLNRVIKARDLDMIYICGPGHGGPGMVANTWLEGTYSEIYPTSRRTKRECAACSSSSAFPAASRATPRRRRPDRSMKAASSDIRSRTPMARRSTTPTSIVACVVGDGEAETGPLATSWHSNKFLNPGARRRGSADPASQRLQDRQPNDPRADRRETSLTKLFRRLWLQAAFRRGRRPREDASADGGDAR